MTMMYDDGCAMTESATLVEVLKLLLPDYKLYCMWQQVRGMKKLLTPQVSLCMQRQGHCQPLRVMPVLPNL